MRQRPCCIASTAPGRDRAIIPGRCFARIHGRQPETPRIRIGRPSTAPLFTTAATSGLMRTWSINFLCLIALAACAPLARAQVYHCIGKHGEPVFSGQPCGTPARPPGQNAIAPGRTFADTCAGSPQELRQAITRSFALHDVNRLAGLILWRDMDQASAQATLRLARCMAEATAGRYRHRVPGGATVRGCRARARWHGSPGRSATTAHRVRSLDRRPRRQHTRFRRHRNRGLLVAGVLNTPADPSPGHPYLRPHEAAGNHC